MFVVSIGDKTDSERREQSFDSYSEAIKFFKRNRTIKRNHGKYIKLFAMNGERRLLRVSTNTGADIAGDMFIQLLSKNN